MKKILNKLFTEFQDNDEMTIAGYLDGLICKKLFEDDYGKYDDADGYEIRDTILNRFEDVLISEWKLIKKGLVKPEIAKTDTVTGALKSILTGLGLFDKNKNHAYSDSRKVDGKKAVGVKFLRINPSEKQIQVITDKMEELGYTHFYTRQNKGTEYSRSKGYRFCYSKTRD